MLDGAAALDDVDVHWDRVGQIPSVREAVRQADDRDRVGAGAQHRIRGSLRSLPARLVGVGPDRDFPVLGVNYAPRT
jgi:hypothetical protein